VKKLSVAARSYIVVLAFSAAVLVTLALRSHHAQIAGHNYWFDLVWFGILFLFAEAFSIVLPHGGAYSVSFVIVLSAIITRAGPDVAVVAAAFALFNVVRSSESETPLARRLFNASQFVISSAAAGYAYLGAARALDITDRLPSPHHAFASPAVLIPVLAAAVAYFLVNTWLVSGVLALVYGSNPLKTWHEEFSSFIGAYFAFALLGFLLGTLSLQMGAAAILFLLVPLLVARHAFQASVRMHGAYDQTVRSLITAIEKKDPYTGGHAERVARLSEMTAREYGLPDDRIRLVRFAALMHDVGKLGVSTRVLQKPGKLTPEEYEHMKLHPLRGHEIVGEIDFLAEAVGAVRHHHERMDGGGYPDGIAGGAIPLLARVIMVADAFDSMTSTRVYRKAKNFDEAFAELHRCEGTQFDSRCLAALEGAIAKHGWEAFPELDEEEDANATAASL
jgi:HD-GYP domain-containing protein (c-di-GMP phosphodiesterase class II)